MTSFLLLMMLLMLLVEIVWVDLVDSLFVFSTTFFIRLRSIKREDVLKAREDGLDSGHVKARKKGGHWLDTVLIDDEADLLITSVAKSVCKRPCGLDLDLKTGDLEEMEEKEKNSRVNDTLDLETVAGDDVADSETAVLDDAFDGMAQQWVEVGEELVVDEELSLFVVSCDDVADGDEGCVLDCGTLMSKKGDQTRTELGVDVDDLLDPVLG